jgi:hypothetical protein
MMLDSMRESILMYGVEIWRWTEQEEIEKVQDNIFERGARSGQRNARLPSERRVY